MPTDAARHFWERVFLAWTARGKDAQFSAKRADEALVAWLSKFH
jgi:hypothetical protein